MDFGKLDEAAVEEEVGKEFSKTGAQSRLVVRRFIQDSCDLARCLPAKEKLLFLMRYDHGYSTSEIAKLCSTTEDRVRKRINRISKHINFMRTACNGKGEKIDRGKISGK